MIARATTTVAVLRGSSTDALGDEIAGTTPVAEGIPASVLEDVGRRVTTDDDPDPRVVRSYVARLPAGTDIRAGDRLQDEATDVIYLIDSTSDQGNPIIQGDLILQLRRTT